ncbi:hypothetical protein CDD83_3382 [Cordyceps sp. RAO-2017]|nr:hypothetical protein CDD83_3382 [Cordyceps sp. RAO-2017]
MLEAAYYFNAEIYPFLAAHQLAPTPFVAPIVRVEHHPPSMRHAIVSLVLGHRVLHLAALDAAAAAAPTASSLAGSLRWRVHCHVGHAIRALNGEIERESTRCATTTIVCVFILLIGELFQSASPQWRFHNDGLATLVALRGGVAKLVEDEGEIIKPGMLSLLVMSVMANATSPSHQQVAPIGHSCSLATIADLYACGIYPRLPCPQELFVEIVRTNQLRRRLAHHHHGGPAARDAARAVRRQHQRLPDFSPPDWAAAREASSPPATWLLLGRLFHSAAVLFAHATLAGFVDDGRPAAAAAGDEEADPGAEEGEAGPDPGAEEGEAGADPVASHRAQLFRLLEQGLASEVTRYGILWPLVVAGFEAAHGTPAQRVLVERGLIDMSRESGAAVVVARNALKAFWLSGKRCWDDCFHEPFALVF